MKELAICAVARELDCEFEWAAHADHARKAGVREEAIKIVRIVRRQRELTESEAEVVRYVLEFLRPPHRVP
jgi:alkylhydroperoxidase family enzyme